jgi:hypothetical protein
MEDTNKTSSLAGVPQQLGTILLIILIIGLIIAVSRNARSTWPVFEENFNLSNNTQEAAVPQEEFTDENEFYSISAQIPNEELDTAKVMESEILAGVISRQQEWKIGGEIHQSELELSAEFPDRPIMKYEYLSSYTKTSSEKMQSVSYLVNTYEFTGGAHGMSYPATYSFNKNGQILISNILDIDNTTKQIELTQILAAKLKQELGDMLDSEMLNMGLGLSYLNQQGQFDPTLCDCGTFTPKDNFNNFIITDEGVTFIFGPYQVAAYAVGMPEVTLSWEELAPYLKN